AGRRRGCPFHERHHRVRRLLHSPFVQTMVVRVAAPGPTAGSTVTTVPATCATGTGCWAAA
ncbi:MAG: hypothetical protein ACRDTZ_22330, partial [Pseudonocardiaceae bacterium]